MDPFSYAFGNQSPYLYASNNPVTFIDYLGLYSDDFWKKIQNGDLDDIESGHYENNDDGTWDYSSIDEWYVISHDDGSYSTMTAYESHRNSYVGTDGKNHVDIFYSVSKSGQANGGSTFDNIQPGIDRAGDLGGFLVSMVETPFVIRSGELGMLGNMKNIPYSQAKRVLNQYTKGAVRGLRTASRTAGVAGLVVGAGVSTFNLSTGNGQASDIADLFVLGAGALVIGAAGVSAAPFVAAGGLIYGGVMLFGGEDYINNSAAGQAVRGYLDF